MSINDTTGAIIGAAIEVHRALGPGLLESTYETCLAYEVGKRGLLVERQKPLDVTYKGIEIECGYRVDLLVAEQVIVEVKSVARLEAIHDAQLLTYLRLSGYPVGLLINFNAKQLTSGLRRFVNESFRVASVNSVLSVVTAVVSIL